MNLSGKKRSSLDFLLTRLDRYRQPDGSIHLREDFRERAPVWSIFWHHVLFDTPLFDRYTHAAFKFLAHHQQLTPDQAIITCPGHWHLYDTYCSWFNAELQQLSRQDPTLNNRLLDRALMMYGDTLI